jgi:uncharacterized protein involved in exopolysaccharide biosynthesis
VGIDKALQRSPRWSIGTVWRAAALLLATTLVGGALGLGAATLGAASYTARSTVLVTPLEGNPFNPVGNGDALENLESEAQLANSDAVSSKVAADEPGASSTLLLNGLTVTVPPNTQILTISYKAPTAELALSRAQGFARGYLDLRAERADQAVVAQAAEIQDEIDAQTDRLNTLSKRKSKVIAPEQRAVLQQQIDGVTAQVIQLSTTLSAVQTIDRDPGEVITPAHIIGRPPAQKRALFLVLGQLLGCAAGVLVLVLRARSRHSAEPPAVEGPHVVAKPAVNGWTKDDDDDDDDIAYPSDLVSRGRPG